MICVAVLMYFGGKQGSLSPNGVRLRQGVSAVDDRWGCRYSKDAVLAALEKRAGWYAEGLWNGQTRFRRESGGRERSQRNLVDF